MHATVTGIRRSSHFWVMGADRTQSLALDEIFSKKPIYEGEERSTMVLRKTEASRQNSEGA